MANTIHVTACDNELIILAYQWGVSYELCRILSGNSNAVDLTFTINAGLYTGSMTFNDVNTALNASLNTYLPAGDYSLLLIGVNWGGPTQFNVDVNGNPYNSPGGSAAGCIWTPDPIAVTV